ncbi:procathepsin L-like [Thomomys bottae]
MHPSVLLAILCLGMASAAPTFDPSLDAQWTQWKTKYKKSYNSVVMLNMFTGAPQTRSLLIKIYHQRVDSTRQDEEAHRRAAWEENMKKIEVHNEESCQGKHNFTLETNAFADMTPQEFRQVGIEFQPDDRYLGQMYQDFLSDALPASVDWREKGYVTPVKYQGNCNACWAFCANGALEGQMFKKTGKLVSLSEQNLVDCSRPPNGGCKGGRHDWALQYVQDKGGLNSQESYPYEGGSLAFSDSGECGTHMVNIQDGRCRYKPENSVANVSGIVRVPASEEALMRAVATVGPIAVALHARLDSFLLYKRGIYYDPKCSSTFMTHCAVVVGYGFEGEESEHNKYWLVKNSWGHWWGMNGYIKIARGRNNQCGIASSALYPTV